MATLDLPLLLAQLLVVLAAARLAGWLARAVGQPAVVGEMAAGLALGPSLFGALAPRAAETVFPPSGLAPLNVLSQLGVLLFMFLVGLRLDGKLLRGQTRAAVVTSHASIAVPFGLGLLLAPRLYPELAGAEVELRTFALFVGAAMSVTAFPVLARILHDRGLTATRVGTMALACAAVDDVTAWCMLAGVLAAAHADSALASAALAVASVALYAGVALALGRPLLRRLLVGVHGSASSAQRVGVAVLVALASALATERLGVHALFGAFLGGVIMPREDGVAAHVADRLDAVVTTVLLPVFFAFTGLRTSIGLVSGAAAWQTCALIVVVAVAGKLGGSAVASRLTGSSWRDALAIGALLNTRGLMELVILTIGLDAGVISPTLFAMMVLMALVTTVMTSPLLAVVGVRAPRTALP